MPFSQADTIRAAIDKLEQLPPERRERYFAQFEEIGHEARWVQVIVGTVNFAYPYRDDPIERLESSRVAPLAGMALQEWEHETNVILTYRGATSEDVANFVDALFTRVLNAPSGYRVNVTIEEM